MKRTTRGAFDRPRPLSGQPFLTCLTVVCEIADLRHFELFASTMACGKICSLLVEEQG